MLERRPDFAVAHNNLAIALRELGQLDQAFEHFQRAAQLDPTFASCAEQPGPNVNGPRPD